MLCYSLIADVCDKAQILSYFFQTPFGDLE